MNDAYAAGLGVAIPVAPGLLGWAMDGALIDPGGAPRLPPETP